MFLYNENGKIAPFLLQRRHLGYILSEKIHASYKMYFDDNISNVGIGLDVLINSPASEIFMCPVSLFLRRIPKYIIFALSSNQISIKFPCCDIDVTLF